MKKFKLSTRAKAELLSKVLPKSIYDKLIRSKINVPAEFEKNYEVKLAETEEEYYDAFRILHESYVDAGFMIPSPSGLRVTKYHALHTTHTIVIKYNKAVIGTCSIIVNGEFGMPINSIYRHKSMKLGDTSIAEISSLAIDKKFRKGGPKALFLLLKGMWQLCSEELRLKTIYAVANPKHLPLYSGILQLEKQNKHTIEHYGFVDGAPAVILKGDLAQVESKFKKLYSKKADNKNLYRLMQTPSKGGLNLPHVNFDSLDTSINVINYDLYRRFFMELTDAHYDLTSKEQNILSRYFSTLRIAA